MKTVALFLTTCGGLPLFSTLFLTLYDHNTRIISVKFIWTILPPIRIHHLFLRILRQNLPNFLTTVIHNWTLTILKIRYNISLPELDNPIINLQGTNRHLWSPLVLMYRYCRLIFLKPQLVLISRKSLVLIFILLWDN
jgi:hypothetical protein